ncbi:L-histidine N(alpha)-methyltransferase [Sphingomicrobium astaxanthinifaciens]|uniref:L-histidine N(alpha)-methyltransferase n=1 Tax=Sphingomicrobium astaxanthinifaciens TaxID=1227949 RepID=UPI001FCC78BC|nr:L-histidine N(alpha)-methyltransferase [Sphingomicrobium astaxanthinifaciens]MCJ7421306.1 L-histidine N(alpha)-methyltransferase [Sphingomicrobium astaxanthinifaciens]
MPEAAAPAPTVDPAFRADVKRGLAQPEPAVPARWLYDTRGSELFDAITRLDEYYPTRTETAIMRDNAAAIAAAAGKGGALIEFGAGSVTKTPLMLDALEPDHYVPIDISGDYLRASAAELQQDHPDLAIDPIEADFTKPFDLPDEIAGLERIGFFPGSTIGNFVPRSAADLLRTFRDILRDGSKLLIGMDRIKDLDRLRAAYDDRDGVTAAFNKNLLTRMQRELGAELDPDAFVHEARWNEMLGRIEMHLVAVRDTAIALDGERFAFARGDSIHTENSHKYGPRGARCLLLAGGWTPTHEWTDPAGDFAFILAEAQPNRFAP